MEEGHSQDVTTWNYDVFEELQSLHRYLSYSAGENKRHLIKHWLTKRKFKECMMKPSCTLSTLVLALFDCSAVSTITFVCGGTRGG